MNIELLNDKQKEAVTHIDGPMLVLAGAGSGKTKVLTSRIAYLMENGVKPQNILAITFTNKAAKEMKDRVSKLIHTDVYKLQISTFHSFGLKLIKENYNLLGYEKNFTIIDSDDALTIIKKIMKDFDLNPKFYNAKDIRNKISSSKNELMSISDFMKLEYDDNVVRVYEKYLKTLKSNNSVDFDDLLLLPIKLFREHKDVLKKYQELYKYILIDEYQDTNEAQYILSKMLSASHKNLFVVGDNDQAIYAFRGANFKNILNFEKDYPDCKVILLEENYRSTQNILNAANSVIKHNNQRKDKNLWSSNDSGSKVKYIMNETDRDECKYVSSEIKKLVDNSVNYEDIAILYRTNAQSRLIEEEMLKNGIPYRVVGSFYFYNRKEIKDLICYLRLINNYKDDASLLRVINIPKRKIGEKTINNIVEKAEEDGISLFEAINSGKELEFKKLIISLKEKSSGLSLTELVELVLDKSGLKRELKEEKSLEADIRLENLEEFKSITKAYEEEYGEISLDDFLEEVTLVSDMSEHQDSANKVSLMTVHAVKGLEFDHVFVIGMEEEIFPHYNALKEGTNSAIEEERRLCYVAITRAKKNLYMLNAKKRMLFGNVQCNLPSRFMDEIDSEYIEVLNECPSIFKKVTSFAKDKMFNEEDVKLSCGDQVKHDKYGIGVVVDVQNSIATIAFPHPIGIKKLLKNHKSITKIS